MNPIVIFLLISLASSHCLEDDNCEQMDFPTSQDEIRMRENSAMEGHLLSEHTSPNHYSCFVRCADNCHCLSFNFNSHGRVAANCQLQEAASYTNPESIKPKTGWAYIEMVRSYLTKVILLSLHPLQERNAFLFRNKKNQKGQRRV